MSTGPHVVLRAATRFYIPLALLFALSLLLVRPPGGGVGFIAGMAFALALLLHVVLFGAAAARAAMPPPVSRALLALGLAAVLVGTGAPNLQFAGQMIEGGLFAITVGAASLIVGAIVGRVPTLRDEDW